MAEWLTQEEIARRAYEAWRYDVNQPHVVPWGSLPDLNREAWIACVARYHEKPWGSMEDGCDRARHVREAATKAGR